MSAPTPTSERQEHLDAVVSFAGARQRRRLFRELDIRTIKWATGVLPEEWPIPAQHTIGRPDLETVR